MARVQDSIAIRMGDTDQLRVRIVVSPLASAAANLFEVIGGRRPDPPDAWDATLRDRARRLELGPLDVFRLRQPVPDFLLPVPTAGRHTFAQELERLRATPDDAVRRELREEFAGRIPAAYAALERAPRAGIERYCAALGEYWRLVLEPSWRAMSLVLEREVLVAGGRLATDRPEATLDTLHPRLRCRDGVLRYPSSHSATVDLRARPLVLVPVICSPNGILTNEAHPDAVRLGYTPPGAAEVWGAPAPAPSGQLEAMLGATRAGVLAALAAPDSTNGLAQRRRLSPSTVSHHLTALADAGLVESARTGRVVYYRLTERGARVLELFDQPV